ncbi:MAG: hypothetical protein ACYDG2_04275 [Ruminiclostridium sp.]
MKYTKQEARKILGVTKNSSKYDIEMKYDVLMKKYRILKSDGKLDEQAEDDFIKYTEAYRIIMGYEVDEPQVQRKATYTDKAFKKAGLDKKKADNFFYYYKFHILISIFAIIIIGLVVRSFVIRVDPDITIGFIGEVNSQDFDKLKVKIEEKLPEIKEVAFDSAAISNNYNDAQAAANLSKIMIMLSVSDTDLFIMSRYAYNQYAPSGPFMALEDVAKELNIDVSKSDYLKLKVVDEWEDPTTQNAERKALKYRDTEPKLYGIDVTNNEFFKGTNVIGPEKILVIRMEPKNRDLVLKLVKLFSK